MPNTSRGYTYPDSSGHTRMWEHLQELASDINSDVANIVALPITILIAQAAQSCADGVDTALNFGSGSEEQDTHGFHNETTNPSRITPTVAGKYELSGTVFMSSSNAYTVLDAFFRKNGNPMTGRHRVNPAATTSTKSLQVGPRIVTANGIGDYFELGINQNSGGAKNTNAGGTFSSMFQCKYIGPL